MSTCCVHVFSTYINEVSIDVIVFSTTDWCQEHSSLIDCGEKKNTSNSRHFCTLILKHTALNVGIAIPGLVLWCDAVLYGLLGRFFLYDLAGDKIVTLSRKCGHVNRCGHMNKQVVTWAKECGHMSKECSHMSKRYMKLTLYSSPKPQFSLRCILSTCGASADRGIGRRVSELSSGGE